MQIFPASFCFLPLCSNNLLDIRYTAAKEKLIFKTRLWLLAAATFLLTNKEAL
jgi:hypothetical protein